MTMDELHASISHEEIMNCMRKHYEKLSLKPSNNRGHIEVHCEVCCSVHGAQVRY